jgi:hypothetical protein
MIYIGIDSAPSLPHFTLAVLDSERHLVALSQGPMAEMLSYAAGQTQAIVAINFPPRPNQGCVTHQDPLPEMGSAVMSRKRDSDLRLGEYLLHQKGFSVPRTSRDPAHCQGWVQRGFALFEQLQSMGYSAYPSDAPRTWLETQAEACYQALLGLPPFTAGTLEGRLQRQLVLRDQRLPVADAMDFFEEVTRHKLLHGILPVANLHPQPELNALMSAQIAFLAATKPEQIAGYGDAAEGVIYLPSGQGGSLSR